MKVGLGKILVKQCIDLNHLSDREELVNIQESNLSTLIISPETKVKCQASGLVNIFA